MPILERTARAQDAAPDQIYRGTPEGSETSFLVKVFRAPAILSFPP